MNNREPETRMVVGGLLMLATIPFYFAWHTWPSLWLALPLFASLFVGNILQRLYVFLPGGVCNSAAVLSNGGLMPVMGNQDPPSGVWTVGNADTVFPFLCDQAWFAGGSSIGDTLIVGGLIIYLVRRYVAYRGRRLAVETP